MTRIFKRVRARSASRRAAAVIASEATSSTDLRQIIADLEEQLAEQEVTNDFLRDLLAQQRFDTPFDERDESRSLEHA